MQDSKNYGYFSKRTYPVFYILNICSHPHLKCLCICQTRLQTEIKFCNTLYINPTSYITDRDYSK